MLAESQKNQLDILSQALIKQRENQSSSDEAMAVLFFGQQFDSFPRDLLLDETITAIDKYAWQRLYIELQQNRNYFPTYDNLQKLWGNMGGLLSRKTVRDILSRLVLSGWLSFKVIRGDNGQIAGNVYMLHNSQLQLFDIITQNDESITHIFSSIMSKKEISRSLAVLTYNQVKSYLSKKEQSSRLFLQIKGGKKEMVITHNIDEIAPSLLKHLENTLSSKKELSKNILSSKKELGENILSSKKELGENVLSSKKELGENVLSSKKEPLIKTISYDGSSSSTSSIYSSTTTNDNQMDSSLVIPSNVQVRITDKGLQDIMNVITKTGISLLLVNQILQSISNSDINQIKNMTAYLVRNIQKAAKGEYNLVIPNTRLTHQPLSFDEIDRSNIEIKQKQVVSKERLSQLFEPLKKLNSGCSVNSD